MNKPSDTDILDFIEANPRIRWCFTVNKFFGDHWRRIFGSKGDDNRFKTFREAVIASIRAKENEST